MEHVIAHLEASAGRLFNLFFRYCGRCCCFVVVAAYCGSPPLAKLWPPGVKPRLTLPSEKFRLPAKFAVPILQQSLFARMQLERWMACKSQSLPCWLSVFPAHPPCCFCHLFWVFGRFAEAWSTPITYPWDNDDGNRKSCLHVASMTNTSTRPAWTCQPARTKTAVKQVDTRELDM